MMQLDVKGAMNLAQTYAKNAAASMSMAHHPTLGIVTADSLRDAGKPDTSPIADNPPVSGAAGASDPQIAAVVRGIRERSTGLASKDRAQDSGKYDETKTDPDEPGSTFKTGFVARSVRRMNKGK